ncbi:MAG: hypothetical protein SCALA702_26170 [Melioribacteraceae bacterium]|nr:MAG: hypothetical protein SCALA702_26170 [Melioribacteraceae bacterium]
MKTIIGADGNRLEDIVAKRFGHADYYLIYDHNDKTYSAIKNIEELHDHDNLRDFVASGVNNFVVGNIGPHAFTILKEKKSHIFLARKMKVIDAIEKLESGELKELSEPTVKKSIGHDH